MKRFPHWSVPLAVTVALGSLGWNIAGAVQPRPARNIFWPTEYREDHPETPPPRVGPPPTNPPPPRIGVPAPDWEEATRALQIGGIVRSSSGIAAALINGRPYAPGDIIEMIYRGYRYRFKLKAVDDQGVDLERVAADSGAAGSNAEKGR